MEPLKLKVEVNTNYAYCEGEKYSVALCYLYAQRRREVSDCRRALCFRNLSMQCNVQCKSISHSKHYGKYLICSVSLGLRPLARQVRRDCPALGSPECNRGRMNRTGIPDTTSSLIEMMCTNVKQGKEQSSQIRSVNNQGLQVYVPCSIGHAKLPTVPVERNRILALLSASERF